jgi:acyl-CoA reductase-like NAD-dependent aldehyde dehydrogenase
MTLTTRYQGVVAKQRAFFATNKPVSFIYRIEQLNQLKQAILTHQSELTEALFSDLHKSEFESYLTEIGLVLHELTLTTKQLKKWMKPQKVKTPLLSQPAKSYIYSDPLGVCLIISPFNYPVSLCLLPLIAAIAAGNCCIVKTSELTPNVSRVLKKLINSVFTPEYIECVNGDVDHATSLLAQNFDHIFFTGSTQVGKIVMQAAAKHLTPVTLELGGKSPCIVCADANIDVAVKRIVYGKMLNAGQTCVAPDYVLVDDSIKKEFLQKLTQRIKHLYGEDASKSQDFGRLVSQRHAQRISDLIDPDKVLIGGDVDIEQRYIAPTVMHNIDLSDAIMQEEIFGPVLPVLSFSDYETVFNIIQSLPSHPLAAYIFSENKQTQDILIVNIQAGGVAINHCVQHLANPYLPFGGVGLSGIGSYHGKHGFDRFSHQKSVLKAATWFDLPVIYPPYKNKLSWLKKILK